MNLDLPSDPRPHVQVQTMGRTTSALVDTGAAVTCCSKEFFESLHDKDKLQAAPTTIHTQVTGVSGSEMTIAGRFYIPLRFLGVEVTRPMFVISGMHSHEMILGIDFIKEMHMTIKGNKAVLPTSATHRLATLNTRRSFVVPARTIVKRRVHLNTRKDDFQVGEVALVTGGTSKAPYVWSGIQQLGRDHSAVVVMANNTDDNVVVTPDVPVGYLEKMKDQDPKPMTDRELIAAINSNMGRIKKDPPAPDPGPAAPLTASQKATFLEKLQLECPDEWRPEYTQLCLDYHDVFSKDKFDLGKTDVIQHSIRLKDDEPVHVKQFPLPMAHRETVMNWVEELLAQGAIELSRSCYNSPIFLVPKPKGGLRAVLDFRKLNQASVPDKYVIREIRACIDEVGQDGSRVFTAVDLTSGFWQQVLEEESRQYSAFTVPGGARYQWCVTPMGLQGSPASFARLIDHVMRGAAGVIAYIDDVLVHSVDHKEHLRRLKEVFLRLRRFNLKANPGKTLIGAKQLSYLGFLLTEHGIGPGPEKLEAMKAYPAPESVKQIREFLGMANYWRGLIPSFAQHAGQMTKLLKKDSGYKKGKMPEEAIKAFEWLKNALVSGPVVRHPAKGGEWHLTTDASQGDKDYPGGLGAVLTQIVNGEERVIGYASRSLKQFERNYSAYLLELAAAEWAIDYFSVYLMGREFHLWVDHRPLLSLSTVHKKTLNRLQQQLLEHSFKIGYKKGPTNVVADALSRNPVDVLDEGSRADVTNDTSSVIPPTLTHNPVGVLDDDRGGLRTAQEEDQLCQDVRRAMAGATPRPGMSEGYTNKVNKLAKNCHVFDGILYYWLQRDGFRTIWAALAPVSRQRQIIEAAHNTWTGGHGGECRTANRIQTAYFWPGVTHQVQKYVQSCPRCQECKGGKPPPTPLQSLPLCEGANERVHIDLFGPMRTTSASGNRLVMVVTDAYTKLAILVAIPDKSAETVAKAFFEKYICIFSVPLQIVTDRGKEFCNQVLDDLCDLLGIKHKRTTAYHPATNSSAESFNRSMKKYLTAMLNNDETLAWEEQLPMLQLAYNSHIHKSINESPFFLTFLHDPRLPYFDLENPRKMYNTDYPTAAFQTFQEAYKRTYEQQWDARAIREEYYNRKAKERSFDVGDKVMFYSDATPLKINAKFFKRWGGPYYVTKKISPLNYEIQRTPRSKPFIVHIEKIKLMREDQAKKAADSKRKPQHPEECHINEYKALSGEEIVPTDMAAHSNNGFLLEDEEDLEDEEKMKEKAEKIRIDPVQSHKVEHEMITDHATKEECADFSSASKKITPPEDPIRKPRTSGGTPFGGKRGRKIASKRVENGPITRSMAARAAKSPTL